MHTKTVLAGSFLFLALASSGLGQQVVATGRQIQYPQVAVAGTGDFMIVWSDLDNGVGNPSSLGVFARLFDPSGEPRGRAFRVNENRVGDQFLPRVAADEQGHFVVVWQGGVSTEADGVRPGGDGDGTGAFAQRIDRDGTRLGPAIRLSRSAKGDQLTPDVAMASDGSFLAVWQNCTAARHRCSELHVGRFTAGGERKGEELKIPVLTATFYLGGNPSPNPRPYVAIEPDGFAVAWTEQESCYKFAYEKFPVVVHFTDSGQPAGERFRLDDGLCDDGTGWILAALTTSRTGSSAAFFNGDRNSFQLFKPGGDPAGQRKLVGRRNACEGDDCESIGDAAMDSGGRFAVVWNREVFTRDPNPAAPYRFSLQAQFFDPLGQPLGKRIEVASSPASPSPGYFPLAPPAVAFARDGSLIVVWADDALGAYTASHSLFFRKIRRN